MAFLLLLIAGIWIAVAWFMTGQSGQRRRRIRMIVARILIAFAGLLLIITTYWGQLFSYKLSKS